MNFNYTASPEFRKAKNEFDLEILKKDYEMRFEKLDKCVKDGDISSETSKKIKDYLNKRYQAEKFLIPTVNDLSFRFEDKILKGLEKVFEKI